MSKNESVFDDFVASIQQNLQKNGFPEKAVAFPLETMFEAASRRGFSFNKVRDHLKKLGIETDLEEQRVVFRSTRSETEPFDLAALAAQAQELLQKLSPEQQAELKNMMQKMNPQDMDEMRQRFENMPAAERARLMEEMQRNPLFRPS